MDKNKYPETGQIILEKHLLTRTNAEKLPKSYELRINNFDLLRFLFAAIVFLVHAYVLSGEQSLHILAKWLSSDLAVQSFFVVSGFLIFMSYENTSRLGRYFENRIRRIFPAYIAVILLAILAGSFLTTLSWGDYFSSSLLEYLAANLIFLNFLHPDLPGVFVDNHIHAVNGALWTLKIEVMFYLSVPVLVWIMRRFGCWQTLLLFYIFSLLYVMMLEWWGGHGGLAIFRELQRQLPGQLCWFIAGGALYYYHDYFRRWWPGLLGLAMAAMLFRDNSIGPYIAPAALAIIVVYFACVFPSVGNFGKFGDFSYGIYITHFPILQALIACGLFDWSPLAGLLVATILILSTAFLFWHGIEKRFLRRSSHYIEAAATNG